MITEPTVLILGAGASKPYGFPTGMELKKMVLDEICQTRNNDLFEELGFSIKDRQLFSDALRRSGKASVDAFLEHRREYLELGKAAISRCLIPCEDELTLYSDRTLFEIDENWYQYIFNRMNSSFDDFSDNNISFITFNYDRSLEHYLFTCLLNSYGKSESDCLNKLCQIPFIHLHGSLGFLPWQSSYNSEIRQYKRDFTYDDIKISASQIKIIHEDVEHNPEFKLAQDKIKNANRIYFVGFGYDRTNLNRLISDISFDNKIVMGTAIGFTGKEMNEIQNEYGITLISGYGITTFFRNNAHIK